MSPDGSTAAATQSRIVIYTLGRFEVLLNGLPLRFKGRAPVRSLELLTLLIAAGDGGASAGRLADQLWPDADGFDAYRAFTTTLHRLRRLLGCHEAVRLSAGRLSLDKEICTIDAWEFERELRGAADADAIDAVLDSCPGPFLADDENPWVIAAREKLENLKARTAQRLAQRRNGAPTISFEERLVGAVRPAFAF
jgi:LuxR family transcriptional regulator, maltose regulon positive regulatory protein